MKLNPADFKNDEITLYTTVISKNDFSPAPADKVHIRLTLFFACLFATANNTV
jgi:hypothetical protein